jgi:hypothetical protein
LSGFFLKSKKEQVSFIDENIWELWEPKTDEYCWFFEDAENFPLGFVLDKFSRKDRYNNYVTQCSGESFECCLPFQGDLPL